MKTGQRDPRIEMILKKYYGLYDLPDNLSQSNELEAILRQRVLEEKEMLAK